jgi:hypothetical protein
VKLYKKNRKKEIEKKPKKPFPHIKQKQPPGKEEEKSRWKKKKREK